MGGRRVSLRAKVHLAKAEGLVVSSRNSYQVARQALKLLINVPHEDWEVSGLGDCPTVELEEVKQAALQKRQDLKALEGKGYMVGAGISWSFDTGFSTLSRKVEAPSGFYSF